MVAAVICYRSSIMQKHRQMNHKSPRVLGYLPPIRHERLVFLPCGRCIQVCKLRTGTMLLNTTIGVKSVVNLLSAMLKVLPLGFLVLASSAEATRSVCNRSFIRRRSVETALYDYMKSCQDYEQGAEFSSQLSQARSAPQCRSHMPMHESSEYRHCAGRRFLNAIH